MTITKAAKVTKRNWSLEKFTASVKSACKKAEVAFVANKMQKAYDEGVTVRDTVELMRPAKKAAAKKAA